ncbi:Uu.00g009520.m01.CDS01 [Anthostomella pinea]|uniref:U three protein 23 n=1 Tax=Anthostomella pinea TaxID=933095 RepID=A0AAI8VXE5_9PEZI|nr:Uu.00g009520.m01.CDS01 [Anthostomella pinea]
MYNHISLSTSSAAGLLWFKIGTLTHPKKQYKKLMNQVSLTFGFRTPYQVLVDADFLLAATQSDLLRTLENTLHGEVKLLITQCCMRHLYARNKEPGVGAAITLAKEQVERRFCGHHPDQHPEPLSGTECLNHVVNHNGHNKFRYCVAANDDEARASLRQIPGVPLLYIRRSVLIMEPLSTVTVKARSRDEKSKFRAELKAPAGKRKRDEDDTDDEDDKDQKRAGGRAGKTETKKKTTTKTSGPKQPNPLSVQKKKPDPTPASGDGSQIPKADIATVGVDGAKKDVVTENTGSGEAPARKRRRKHKSKLTETAADDPGAGAQGLEAGE